MIQRDQCRGGALDPPRPLPYVWHKSQALHHAEGAVRRHGVGSAPHLFLGFVSVPGVISLYLVWWLTQWMGAKIDRIILLLEQIARALKVTGL